MRLVMRLYLLWPRLELAFVSILPLGLIVESSIANSSAYGFAGFASAAAIAASVVALLRGFLFELLTYVSTRTVAIMVRKGAREHALPLGIMAVLSFFLILVSAVNNLGWVLSGHDLRGLFALLGSLLPSIIYKPYQIGLAVLLPLAVGGIGMDDHAVLVEERIMQRTEIVKGQRAQKEVIEAADPDVAAERPQEQIRIRRS